MSTDYGFANGDDVVCMSKGFEGTWTVWDTFYNGNPWVYDRGDQQLDHADEKSGSLRSRWKFQLKRGKEVIRVAQHLVRQLTEEEKCLPVKRRGDCRTSYIDKYVKEILDSRRPTELIRTETGAFLTLAELLLSASYFILTCSVSEDLNPTFREEYKRRGSGVELCEHGEAKDGTNKRNVACDPETAEKLPCLEGINFDKSWFKTRNRVGSGDRAGLWWGLVDLGFCIGGIEQQDHTLILTRIAEARKKM